MSPIRRTPIVAVTGAVTPPVIDTTFCVLSGGNVDLDLLDSVLADA